MRIELARIVERAQSRCSRRPTRPAMKICGTVRLAGLLDEPAPGLRDRRCSRPPRTRRPCRRASASPRCKTRTPRACRSSRVPCAKCYRAACSRLVAMRELIRRDPGGALLALALVLVALLYAPTLGRGIVNYDEPGCYATTGSCKSRRGRRCTPCCSIWRRRCGSRSAPSTCRFATCRSWPTSRCGATGGVDSISRAS